MKLSDAVRAEGYGFVVDAEPHKRPDIIRTPVDPHCFTALLCGLDMAGGRFIACTTDSWDHAYSVAHEIVEHRHAWRHTEAMWQEQAHILASWLRAVTNEGDPE